LTALSTDVDWLEVRADLVGDLNPEWLHSHFRGNLIYALRSRAEGGNFEGDDHERQRRLREAAKRYDLVDLEGGRDLRSSILNDLPPLKRLVSWHGPATKESDLRAQFQQLSAVEARTYKLVSGAERAGDELAPLCFLSSLGRSDTVAFATGRSGFWSRLVAARLGSPMIFGAIGNGNSNGSRNGSRPHGEPSISRMIEDFGLPALAPLEEIYGIVGNPVHQSLSPRLHNAAYRSMGHPALFVPFHVDSFGDFWREVVTSGTLELLGMSIRGLTVVSPHKEAALLQSLATSPMSSRAGSTNIFVRDNGHWKADTTDPEGVVVAIRSRKLKVEGKRAAVIGCGGAGRAVAAALDQAGAAVTLVNRGAKRGRLAVQLLGLPFVPLSSFTVDGFSILVNATPVGRDDDQMPFELNDLTEDAVVVDLVYGSNPTPLVTNTLARGRRAIDGREVLVIQVVRQFRKMTGREMPVALAREVLGSENTPARSVRRRSVTLDASQ
jgi:3-dehydroquinate dehydratase/shikimate dehydrogenase